jgi:hypothetical protein
MHTVHNFKVDPLSTCPKGAIPCWLCSARQPAAFEVITTLPTVSSRALPTLQYPPYSTSDPLRPRPPLALFGLGLLA